MQEILAITIPFFALVLCGYIAAQRRVLPEEAIPGLNIYVLFFALPCLLFRFGASMPLRELIDPVLIALYAIAALGVVSMTVAVTRRRTPDEAGVDLKNAAFGALVAAFPNTGFMGVPLMVALFGEAAAGPVIGTVLVDLILTSTLCITLAQLPETPATASAGIKTLLLRPLRSAMTNPLPWAIALGALFAATELTLPGPLGQIVRMLGDSATPVALFTIGSVLWRAGLPVSPFGLTILVLAAVLPSASNVSLLAERYGADNGRVARIIMASTVLAFGSFSLLAWVLR